MLAGQIQKHGLTLKNQRSGEEERQKGLRFSLILLNSKKSTIQKILYYKEGGKKTDKGKKLRLYAKRKGVPEPLPAAQVREQAEWRP